MKYLVGLELTLAGEPSTTEDDVTDVIEKVVDSLDEMGLLPNVSSCGAGETLSLTVQVIVDDELHSGQLVSLKRGIDGIVKALGVAGVGIPTAVHPSIGALEPA